MSESPEQKDPQRPKRRWSGEKAKPKPHKRKNNPSLLLRGVDRSKFEEFVLVGFKDGQPVTFEVRGPKENVEKFRLLARAGAFATEKSLEGPMGIFNAP